MDVPQYRHSCLTGRQARFFLNSQAELLSTPPFARILRKGYGISLGNMNGETPKRHGDSNSMLMAKNRKLLTRLFVTLGMLSTVSCGGTSADTSGPAPPEPMAIDRWW